MGASASRGSWVSASRFKSRLWFGCEACHSTGSCLACKGGLKGVHCTMSPVKYKQGLVMRASAAMYWVCREVTGVARAARKDVGSEAVMRRSAQTTGRA